MNKRRIQSYDRTPRRGVRFSGDAVTSLRVMLQDRVNNQLTIMLGAAESRGRDGSDRERADLESAVVAARSVATELENLSLDSLHRWEHRYRRLIPRLLR